MPAYPTSGTFSAVTATSNAILLNRAYGACRLRAEQITGEMVSIGLAVLGFILQDMLNDAAPLWTVNKVLIPLVQGQKTYVLPAATSDVQSAFFRTMSNVTPTITSTLPTSYGFNFGTGNPTQVSSVQIQWPSVPVPIYIQSSPDGVTWTTVYASTVFDSAAAAGSAWYDLSNTNAAQYFQIIGQTAATLPVGLTATVYNVPADVMMYRMNKDDYWNLTNKDFQGRPLQFWMDRQIAPAMDLWPTPDLLSSQNLMVVWRQRYLMDVGTLNQVTEVPSRWYFAILYRLAYELSLTTPEVDSGVIPTLAAQSDKMWRKAWLEERDRSPVKFNTHISVYTR